MAAIVRIEGRSSHCLSIFFLKLLGSPRRQSDLANLVSPNNWYLFGTHRGEQRKRDCKRTRSHAPPVALAFSAFSARSSDGLVRPPGPLLPHDRWGVIRHTTVAKSYQCCMVRILYQRLDNNDSARDVVLRVVDALSGLRVSAEESDSGAAVSRGTALAAAPRFGAVRCGSRSATLHSASPRDTRVRSLHSLLARGLTSHPGTSFMICFSRSRAATFRRYASRSCSARMAGTR